jgi:hypothetical protein
LGCTTKQRSIPFEYQLHLLNKGHQCPLLYFPRVFIVEVDGVGDRGTGDTTMVDVYRHTWDLLNMSLRSASFKNETFFW